MLDTTVVLDDQRSGLKSGIVVDLLNNTEATNQMLNHRLTTFTTYLTLFIVLIHTGLRIVVGSGMMPIWAKIRPALERWL